MVYSPHISLFWLSWAYQMATQEMAAPSTELAKKMKRMTIEEMAKPSPKLAEEMTKVGFKETRAGSK